MSGFDFRKFATDQKKEVEGTWEDIGGGAALLIARAGNSKFQEEYAKIPKGVRRMLENNTIETKSADELICGILARTILLDWKNMLLDGEPVKYSEDTAKEMLLTYPDFRNMVWEFSNDFQRFHEEGKKEDAKNSKSASSGN